MANGSTSASRLTGHRVGNYRRKTLAAYLVTLVDYGYLRKVTAVEDSDPPKMLFFISQFFFSRFI